MRPGRRIALWTAILTAVTLITAAVTASAYRAPVAHATIRLAAHVTPDPRTGLAGVKRAERPARLDATFTYRVRSGDSLSSISKKVYGHAKDWPVLYHANHIRWADEIAAGKKLTIIPLPRHIPRTPRELAPPAPRAPPASTHTTAAVSVPAAPAASVSVSGYSGFQACVIQRESGGNPQARNPYSTASGLYQFLLTTWDALGFGAAYPGGAATAPVSVQNAAFEKEYAESGTSAWGPYDGC